MCNKKQFEYVSEIMDKTMLMSCAMIAQENQELRAQNEELEAYIRSLQKYNRELKEFINDNRSFAEVLHENKMLREALKNKYITSICENCKYIRYYHYETGYGIEYDSECIKGHFSGEILDCEDFNLHIPYFNKR